MRISTHQWVIVWLILVVATTRSLCLPGRATARCTAFSKTTRGVSLVLGISRGGGSLDTSSAEKTIKTFLDTDGGHQGKFFIQGWRWHTMALVRDARRLEKLAKRMQKHAGNGETLEKAAHHVVNFNMKGLHRIENDLFFPWLRKKLTTDVDKQVGKAFSTVMDEMTAERKKIAQMGVAVMDEAKTASRPDISDEKRAEAVAHVAQLSAALASRTRGLLSRQENILVPAVAALVPDSEQKSFNNKVIRKLGLLDSRIHLVGMHDAVWELDDASERELFQESIPKIPRLMIPRWRKKLYNPQASMLEEK